ncbi:MAG: DMT family transporter [Ardenticatenaceae bacterium]|nr:DMT family transporter [Ardenticatenaceae bacterium]
MNLKSVGSKAERILPSIAISFTRADLMMLGVVLIWGAGFTIVKQSVEIFSPMVFNAARSTLGEVILLIALWTQGNRLRDAGADWWRLIGLGIVGYFGYQLFFVLGISRTTASNSSLLLATVPVLVAAMNTLFRFERSSVRIWWGVLLSFAGILLILLGGQAAFAFGGETFLGDAITLCASLAWAWYIVFSRPYLQRHSALLVTAWAVGTSTVCLWLVALPQLAGIDWTYLPLAVWFGFIYTGVLGVAAAYILWNSAVKLVGGPRVAVYSNLVTVVAVAIAAFTLGEALTLLKLIGGLAVFAGITLTRLRPPQG